MISIVEYDSSAVSMSELSGGEAPELSGAGGVGRSSVPERRIASRNVPSVKRSVASMLLPLSKMLKHRSTTRLFHFTKDCVALEMIAPPNSGASPPDNSDIDNFRRVPYRPMLSMITSFIPCNQDSIGGMIPASAESTDSTLSERTDT